MVSSRFKRNYLFSLKERKDFLLSTSVMTLVFFFFFAKVSWGQEEIAVGFIISKLVMLWLITAVVLFIGIYVAKRFAIIKGYTAKYEAWRNGLLIGFVISFISYGLLPLLFPGIITIKRIERHRHGKFFPGENKRHISWTLMSTLFSFFLITMFMHILYFITNLEFFYYAMVIPAFIACFATLPFNNNIGIHLYYTRKYWYFFFLFFAILLAVFVALKMFFAVLFAMLGMFIIYFLTKKITSKLM